jgi:hypothetical protein
MTLTQKFQMIQGSITTGDGTHAIAKTALTGADISFIAGGLTYQGKIDGNTIVGTITTPSGQVSWSARR